MRAKNPLPRACRPGAALGLGLVLAGACFLFDPFVSIFDILPDFVGYLLIAAGLYRLGDLDDRLADAARLSRRLAWLGLARVLAMVLAFGLQLMKIYVPVFFSKMIDYFAKITPSEFEWSKMWGFLALILASYLGQSIFRMVRELLEENNVRNAVEAKIKLFTVDYLARHSENYFSSEVEDIDLTFLKTNTEVNNENFSKLWNIFDKSLKILPVKSVSIIGFDNSNSDINHGYGNAVFFIRVDKKESTTASQFERNLFCRVWDTDKAKAKKNGLISLPNEVQKALKDANGEIIHSKSYKDITEKRGFSNFSIIPIMKDSNVLMCQMIELDSTDFVSITRKMYFINAIAVLIAILMGLFIIFFIQRRIIGPLVLIRDTADIVVKKGDLTVNDMHAKTNDEIGELSWSFFKMIKVLKDLLKSVFDAI